MCLFLAGSIDQWQFKKTKQCFIGMLVVLDRRFVTKRTCVDFSLYMSVVFSVLGCPLQDKQVGQVIIHYSLHFQGSWFVCSKGDHIPH